MIRMKFMKTIYKYVKGKPVLENCVALLKYFYIAIGKCKEKRLFNSIENCVPKEKQKDKKYIRNLTLDLIKCKFIYGFNYEEYFAFELKNKSKQQRDEYVGTLERYELLKDLSSTEWQKIFDNKYLCYETFKPYYKREVVYIDNRNYEAFCDFVERQRVFIVKPLEYSLGQGIYIVDVDEENRSMSKLFNDIVSYGECVLEEIITQNVNMAFLHPSSVNTIRFVTYFDGERNHNLYALLRMGIGGSCVDNAFIGGLIASVNLETGIVETPGYRNIKNIAQQYDCHPETRAKIKGSQIPKWNELLEVIEELVRIVPEQKIVGWDMALTDNGWVMVEGNSRPIFKSIQLCTGKGFRQTFEKIKNNSF